MTVSYKNHKRIDKDESDWAVIENNHEPIISQELWDKVQEVNASVATGRHTQSYEMHALSGLCYCADCGSKIADIQKQIDLVINEPDIRAKLLTYKKGEAATKNNAAKKRLHDIEKRINELDGLIQSVYEDKVSGKIPEKVCVGLLGKYQAEKDKLTEEYRELEKITDAERQDERDLDEYIRRMKSYT